MFANKIKLLSLEFRDLLIVKVNLAKCVPRDDLVSDLLCMAFKVF